MAHDARLGTRNPENRQLLRRSLTPASSTDHVASYTSGRVPHGYGARGAKYVKSEEDRTMKL